MRILCVLALLASAAYGADVTGKWKGEIQIGVGGEMKSVPAYLELKQEGNSVTGKGGPSEERANPISDGKLEGSTLTFKVAAGENTEAQLSFELKVEDNELKGAVTKSDEPQTSAKLLVKRVQ